MKEYVYCCHNGLAKVGDLVTMKSITGLSATGTIEHIEETYIDIVDNTHDSGSITRFIRSEITDSILIDKCSNTSDTQDMVNHPPHYQSENGLEVIDVIETFTNGLNGIEATDTGNVIKYICRWSHKNGLEDLKKARWYLNHLIERVEKRLTK